MAERVETVEVVVYPLHVGPPGCEGEVFDREEPEQVVKERERRQGKRLPGGKVGKRR